MMDAGSRRGDRLVPGQPTDHASDAPLRVAAGRSGASDPPGRERWPQLRLMVVWSWTLTIVMAAAGWLAGLALPFPDISELLPDAPESPALPDLSDIPELPELPDGPEPPSLQDLPDVPDVQPPAAIEVTS